MKDKLYICIDNKTPMWKNHYNMILKHMKTIPGSFIFHVIYHPKAKELKYFTMQQDELPEYFKPLDSNIAKILYL